MSRRRKLYRRNWNRYLWLEMRHDERAYAWHDRWLREQLHSPTSQMPNHAAMITSVGRLLLSIARSADQSRRFLGL